MSTFRWKLQKATTPIYCRPCAMEIEPGKAYVDEWYEYGKITSCMACFLDSYRYFLERQDGGSAIQLIRVPSGYDTVEVYEIVKLIERELESIHDQIKKLKVERRLEKANPWYNEDYFQGQLELKHQRRVILNNLFKKFTKYDWRPNQKIEYPPDDLGDEWLVLRYHRNSKVRTYLY